MSRFSENLRRIRFERHMTQEEFDDLLGTTKQDISRYKSGQASPKITTAQSIADKLGISLSELNGTDDFVKLFRNNEGMPTEFTSALDALPSNVRLISSLTRQHVPLIDGVAAGQPIYDPEDAGVYVESPVDADATITIHGDSMVPTYQECNLVYIKARPDVPEGAVAVVFLDDEATIKHVYKRPTGLTLWSNNTAYPPMNIEFDDYAVVRIFGVPVGYTKIYKPDIARKIRKGF